MTKTEKRKIRKMLIYLYHYFDGNQAKIFNEINEKKVDCSDQVVNDFIKKNHIVQNAYTTILDGNDIAKEFTKDLNKITFIVKK